MKVLMVILIACALTGCGSSEKEKPAGDSQKNKASSTAQTAIDGFTGKTQVKHGQDAKEQIKQISAEQKKELDEALKGM